MVLKSNMNLVVTVLTSTLSMVFGGGTALLNFLISSVSQEFSFLALSTRK